MPVQNLMQMYNFTEDIMACVILPSSKELKAELITQIGSNQIIASPFHIYACINDSKTNPYAAWTRANGRFLYIRWTKHNTIWKLDQFWDNAHQVRNNKTLMASLDSTLRCYPEPPKPDKPVLTGPQEIKKFLIENGLLTGKK